jgi:hypothetical protein
MTDASGTPRLRVGGVSVDSEAPSPSKGRRRFIWAAGAALPSIYTLSSGAQAAIASNLACWAREPQPAPARFTPNTDNWLRASVYTGEYDGTPAYCVSSHQPDCIGRQLLGLRTNPNDPGSDNAQDGSTWIVHGQRVTSSPAVQITKVGVRPSQYGTVYVDQTGTVLTLDPRSTADLHVVSNSCWTSVLGGRISKLG